MFDKINKVCDKILVLTADVMHFLQVVLVFLSFFVIIFWVLELAQAPFIAPVLPFFESIKTFVHLFYNRLVVFGDVQIDFSFLVASIFFMFLSWSLTFVISFLELTRIKLKEIYIAQKQREEKSFNKQLNQEYLNNELKNNRFIILVNLSVSSLLKNNYGHVGQNQDFSTLQQEMINKFLESFSQKFKIEKNIINEGILLYFEPFENVDKVLALMEYIVNGLKKQCLDKKLLLNYIINIDTYSGLSDAAVKAKMLISLSKIDLKDRITCYPSFKNRYLLLENRRYNFVDEGSYKIGDKEQDIFRLENIV